MKVHASTPSRLCLFGEHQDYLGLEVIACAVDLRFTATARPNGSQRINIRIRDDSICQLGQKNPEGKYQTFSLDLSQPMTYRHKRDYFRSAVKVLQDAGCSPCGAEVQLDSDIPIGKGMCSSSTMVLAYLAALAALWAPQRAWSPEEMARLAWKAEVAEFREPGGMMDHYASALGQLVHLDFGQETRAERISTPLSGRFLLFDSLQQKDTLRVLSDSKYPTLEALEQLTPYGVHSIRDLCASPEKAACLDTLDPLHRRKVLANMDSFRVQREALRMLSSGEVDDVRLGQLLNRHQANLRDGLGISTPTIDRILETALASGAYGGKLNGSGGGGCLFVYASAQKAPDILAAVERMGYPGVLLSADQGLTVSLLP